MNPLTNVKNLQKINERELQMGLTGHEKSWHSKYKNSAWIYFGGVSFELTEGDLLCIFSQYGEIVNINLVRDKTTGKSRGFGFLCYEDQRSTILAVDNFNGAKICNRTFRVDHVENYKPPKDSEEYDALTKLLHEKGCAPEVIAAENEARDGADPGSEDQHADDDEDEKEKDARRKQLKKEKKRAKKAKKKLKREEKKKLKRLKKQAKKEKNEDSSSSSESSSRSSSSESSENKLVVKKEPVADRLVKIKAERTDTPDLTMRSEIPNMDPSTSNAGGGIKNVPGARVNIKREPEETPSRTWDRKTSPESRKYRASRRSRSPVRRERSRSPLRRSPPRSPARKSSHLYRRSSRSRSPENRPRKHSRRSESPRDRHRSSRDDNRSRHRSPDARRR